MAYVLDSVDPILFEPDPKLPAVSFSRIDTFETCPRMYLEKFIRKSVPYIETEDTRYGNLVHDALKDYISKDTPLPQGLGWLAKWADKFKEQAGRKIVEQQLALDSEFEPCAYFGKDVKLRFIGDFILLRKKRKQCIIVDWKTGKPKDDKAQLMLNAYGIWRYYPWVEEWVSIFAWLKHNDFTTYRATTQQMLRHVHARFDQTIDRMKKAHHHDEFPETINGLCRQYCEVFDCPHNGRRAR